MTLQGSSRKLPLNAPSSFPPSASFLLEELVILRPYWTGLSVSLSVFLLVLCLTYSLVLLEKKLAVFSARPSYLSSSSQGFDPCMAVQKTL